MLTVATALANAGFGVSLPAVDTGYDLVSDDHGHFQRIQVKSVCSTGSSHLKSSYHFVCKTNAHATYDQSHCDVFAFVVRDTGQICIRPRQEVQSQSIRIKKEDFSNDFSCLKKPVSD